MAAAEPSDYLARGRLVHRLVGLVASGDTEGMTAAGDTLPLLAGGPILPDAQGIDLAADPDTEGKPCGPASDTETAARCHWREGPAMIFRPILDPHRPQTDLTCLRYERVGRDSSPSPPPGSKVSTLTPFGPGDGILCGRGEPETILEGGR